MFIFLFDIDGTLINSGGAGRDALDAALAETFGKQGSEAVEIHGRTDRSIASNLFRRHAIDDSEDNWQRFRKAYLSLLPARLRAKTGRILPGVSELIRTLGARADVRLGLLTGNVREGARIKLTHHGLFEHFAFGGFGDLHHDRSDVAREALRAAEQHVRLPLDRDRVWVIGDTPHDVSCARAIGARVAAVATGSFSCTELAEYQPDLLLENLLGAEQSLTQA